ncbi:motility associated factor glycosyltransferase family protein [Motilimonas sp. KMU-193]|uniref:motility associated factor glycosyltransferase family protein n=1 Tax=Motilimonas sp. KMU-193 TaxID=3388668 RepID=UPI00396B3266
MNKLTKSLAIIAKRWPKLYQPIISSPALTPMVIHEPEPTYVINDIQLTSCYNRQAEARLQADTIPLTCSDVHVYGIALGDAIAALLTRPQIQSVTVYILNFAIFKLALSDLADLTWLDDPRVSLTFAGDYRHVHSPFIAMPAELVLAESACSRLRDKLYLALDNSYIEASHKNNAQAKQHIIATQHALSQDLDATELLTTKAKRAYIIATGPTLEQSYEQIRARQAGDLIIAVDASLRALDQQQIMPDIVITVDPKPEVCFENIDFNKYQDVSLVYFPRMSIGTLSQWQGPRLQAYSTSSLYDEVDKAQPRLRLYSGGSVIHPAIDLAVKMGIKELVLFGADFGYPKDKTHAFWPSNFAIPDVNAASSHSVLDWRDQKITTLPNLRGYLRDLEDYIEQHPTVTFYSASPQSAKIDGAVLWNPPH